MSRATVNELPTGLPKLMRSLNRPALLAAELLALLLWAMILTQPYLNMNPIEVPKGREYLSHIASNYTLDRFRQCGACALWNGSVRGGAPALADPFSSMLHPLVALPNLVWGVSCGTKIALVLMFILGGWAQWWLAYELGLGRVARLWSGALAVVAGHLSGKMELGTVNLVLSTASCALVLPALLRVTRTGSLRSSVLLGISLVLAGLSGQGYLQIGLVFLLPLGVLLLPASQQPWARLAQCYGLAALLAFLLLGPFLIPLLHFFPLFVKNTDPTLGRGQPFMFVLNNLVINDRAFYATNIMHKLPYPYLYVNYIGWIPLLLAIWGMRRNSSAVASRCRSGWVRLYLALTALGALWIASDTPLRLIANAAPHPAIRDFIYGIQHFPVIAGLAVPPLLGLAACALQNLLDNNQWRFALTPSQANKPLLWLDARWLLVVPLVFSLSSAHQFASEWIGTLSLSPATFKILDALNTSDVQWVDAPFGEHNFVATGIERGLKLAVGVRPWYWRDRPAPLPVTVAGVKPPPPEQRMELKNTVENVGIYIAPPGNEYAVVKHKDDSRTVCRAQGVGGNLDVVCNISQPGVLAVRENSWSGWAVSIDGQSASLLPPKLPEAPWLMVEVPAGQHKVVLRYRPWDVVVGVALALAGLVLAGWMLVGADCRTFLRLPMKFPKLFWNRPD